MILYEKLTSKYGKDLKQILSERVYKNIKTGNNIHLHNVVNSGIDIDSLDYTFEEYSKDFKEQLKSYTEKKTAFNIFKSGYAPSSFYTSTFFKQLTEGFNYNSHVIIPQSKEKLLAVIDIDCDLESYDLRLESYKRHIEVYGEKENLKAFKKNFKLKRPILWEKVKEEWHLAFDGLLCEYIKYKNRD